MSNGFYIRRLFGCHHATLQQGIRDLQDESIVAEGSIRQSGGGRKSALEQIPGIDAAFLRVLADHTAGSPMDEKIKWTNLTRQNIASLLALEGILVSVTVVDQLLWKHYYRKRQAVKKRSGGGSENRDRQFKNIDRLKQEYVEAGHPVVSMDKKKEFIGDLNRKGSVYTTEPQVVYDHNFPSLAQGVAIPHGLYDVVDNIGYIQIGTSRDTTEFACDSIRYWWTTYGKVRYPLATSILLLCDGGGSNSSHYHIFKSDLQALVDDLGIEIRIAHYPPYTSKYNPIKHRLFPHVTRVCQGVILESVELLNELIATTTTRTGLKVFTTILNKSYQIGRTVTENFKENIEIVFDSILPRWNYTAKPTLQII